MLCACFLSLKLALTSRNPTWGNHRNIFADSGVDWKYYSYYDPKTVGLDFEGLTADLEAAPDGSIVVLHGESTITMLGQCLVYMLD